MTRNPRTWLVILGLPILCAAASTLVIWSWRDVLPDPVATHWGLSDKPDGFSSLTSSLWFAGLMPMLGPLIATVIMFASGAAADRMARFSGAFSAGMGAFLAALEPLSLYPQRGLADARDAGGVDWALFVSLAAALVVGALGWFLMPKPAPRPKVEAAIPAGARRANLPAGAVATWSQLVYSPSAIKLLGGVTAVMLIIGVAVQLWFLVGMAALMVGTMLATAAMRITVGVNGIRARGLIGFPVFGVPLDEIVVAETTTVDPIGDFGGWGYRIGTKGRHGVVMRKGPAVAVKCSDDSTFVVTVDGAEEAAALLNTLADRSRSAR